MSVSVDSTFAFDPNVQDSGMAARGLYVTMVTWCDHQMYTRPDEFDGTFDLKRVKNVGGTLRLVRELVANGLFEEVSEGVYTVVTVAAWPCSEASEPEKPLTPEEAAELHNKKSTPDMREEKHQALQDKRKPKQRRSRTLPMKRSRPLQPT